MPHGIFDIFDLKKSIDGEVTLIMAQFVPHVDSEQTFLVGPIQGPFGSVQGCPEVGNANRATTTVRFLRDSSNQKWDIAGIFRRHGCGQEEEERAEEDVLDGEEVEEQQFTGTPMYVVYAHEADSGFCWR